MPRNYVKSYRKPKMVKKYPVKKYVSRLKTGQNSFEKKQPTAVTKRSVFEDQIYQTPIFPASKLIHNQFYYASQNSLSGSVGVVNGDVWSANGLFDPDITGTGHQPIGFDQMMAVYEHYTVIRSKITCTFINNSDDPVRVAIMLSPDSTILTDTSRIMENGLIKTAVMDSKDGTGQRITTLTLDCDIKKQMGRKSYKDLLDDENLRGDSAANPVEQTYFIVLTWGAFAASDANVLYDCSISYDSIYTEPRKLAIS